MAHAGPPFQTDDPAQSPTIILMVYAFAASDSTGKNADGTGLQVPAYEINYGVVPNVQLHLILPLTAVFPPAMARSNTAWATQKSGPRSASSKK